jgi:hypothetical protein
MAPFYAGFKEEKASFKDPRLRRWIYKTYV